jgi:hypothetical protein
MCFKNQDFIIKKIVQRAAFLLCMRDQFLTKCNWFFLHECADSLVRICQDGKDYALHSISADRMKEHIVQYDEKWVLFSYEGSV